MRYFKFNIFLVLLSFLILFFLTGCSIQSSGELANDGVKVINSQSNIQNNLLENSSLENQNITITSSLIQAINNLNKLQKELDNLNNQIDIISKNLNKTMNQTNNNLTLDYLYYLNNLTETSKTFVSSLYKSTFVWDKYLSNQFKMRKNLNFSYDKDDINLINSIKKPLNAFNNS